MLMIKMKIYMQHRKTTLNTQSPDVRMNYKLLLFSCITVLYKQTRTFCMHDLFDLKAVFLLPVMFSALPDSSSMFGSGNV